MKDADSRTEGSRTDKPLLVYDGDCNFCCRSVERLRASTGEAIDYAPYQKVADKYPSVSLREFKKAVHLFMPKGGGTYRARTLRHSHRLQYSFNFSVAQLWPLDVPHCTLNQ